MLAQQTNAAKAIGVAPSDRFRIERVKVFTDDLAYGQARGVYLIHDTVTGRDLVGVSGIGIAELGGHPSGSAPAIGNDSPPSRMNSGIDDSDER